MAAVLRLWSLGLHGLRLVLGFDLLLGLGAIPLWPMGNESALRLGLAAGPCLGTSLGELARGRHELRLGAAAAVLRSGRPWRLALSRRACRREF